MRRGRILAPFSTFVFLALGLITQAYGSGGDILPGSRYVSGRGAALGDAFIGTADDGASALFYNPAALAKLKGVHFEPMNVGGTANTGLAGAFGADLSKFPSLSGYAPTLNDHVGRRYSGSAAVLPSFSMRGIGIGMLAQSRLSAVSDGTKITYRSAYQLIPTAGIGWRLASGVLRMGYSLQWVNQVSGQKTVSTTSSPLGWNQGLKQGAGLSHNFGFALTLPYAYQPSVNLVARNILGLRYSGTAMGLSAPNSAGTLPKEEMSVDAALGLVTKFGKGVNANWALQYRDATNTAKVTRFGHVSAGLEISFRDAFMLRGGYASGYPSVGLGLRSSFAEINLSYFSDEVGIGLRDQQDKKYMAQFILKLF